MALIGKIRQRSGLIVTFVGLGLLLFIIPFDRIIPQFTGESNSGIGLFDGEDITSKEWNYENRLAYEQNQARERNKAGGGNGILSESEEDQILQSVWNQMISERIFASELDKLEISVSSGKKGELNLGLLNPINPVNSSLKNEFTFNNIYEPDSFAVWKRKEIDPLLGTKKGKRDLKPFEDRLNAERIKYKYLSMMKYGVIASHQEGRRLYAEENTMAKIRYIFKRYDEIPDSISSVSDENLKTFFNEHRYERAWEQDHEVRSYDYVILNIDPSEKDNNNTLDYLSSLKEDFANSEDDSLFVAINAETPIEVPSPRGGMQNTGMYSDQAYTGGKFSADVDQQIDSASKGDIIGPFIVPNQKVVQLIKVYDAGEREEATVRHILIASNNQLPNGQPIFLPDPIKKERADSLLRVIKRDTSKFTQLASDFSEDPGSSGSGGIYRWFPKDQMTPEFNDYSFDKPIGSIGVVQTTFGYHIIEVLKRRVGTYKKIAIVDSRINVSEETQNEFYASNAVEFYNKAKKASFDEAAKEYGVLVKKSGYIPLVYPDGQGNNGAFGPAQLNRNMNIAKWAFNNPINSIMEPEFISNNEQLVIAVIKEVIHEGDVTFNNVKTLMKPRLINENKAKALGAQLKNVTSLDEASKILNASPIETKVSYSYVNLDDDPQKIGEPKLIATIFNTEEGKTSALIKGEEGVYMVEVISKTVAKIPEDVSINVKTSTDKLREMVEQMYYYSLYKSYGIKDNRLKRNILQ